MFTLKCLWTGWYRQCHITPYTSDTDFATWSKYLHGQYITDQLKQKVQKHNLRLTLRFGEPNTSLEYSMETTKHQEKVDLFFIYPNQTHFLLAIHLEPKYVYSVYPKYSLCSVELLGYKLLAPCEPEKIIKSGKCSTYK